MKTKKMDLRYLGKALAEGEFALSLEHVRDQVIDDAEHLIQLITRGRSSITVNGMSVYTIADTDLERLRKSLNHMMELQSQ